MRILLDAVHYHVVHYILQDTEEIASNLAAITNPN